MVFAYGQTELAWLRKKDKRLGEVIDRIGSGDAYIAGVLYGLVKSGDVRRALEVGNALSAIKNTILGDLPASSIDEIEGVIRAHKSSGKQDEMIR